MKKNINTFIVILFTLLVPVQLSAEESEEKIRWYQIELILFTYNSPSSLSEEVFDGEVAVEFPQNMQELYKGRVTLADISPDPVPFSTTLDNDYRLRGIYSNLSRSGRTSPQLHLSWIQPATVDGKPVDIHIHSNSGTLSPPATEAEFSNELPVLPQIQPGYEAGLGFDGVIRLISSRYLHLQLDMGYREKSLSTNHEENREFSKEPGVSSSTISEVVHDSYRMKQKRRLRKEEIHYFDHPRFGVIAQITDVEIPEPEIEQPLTEEQPLPNAENTGDPADKLIDRSQKGAQQ